jgi:hypothetical protein
MDDSPYQSPSSGQALPGSAASPPAWMVRTYAWSFQAAVFGAGGAFVFAVAFLPPCACGFAAMPSWRAWMILLAYLSIVLLVGVSAILAIGTGLVLRLGYGVRRPAMILPVLALLFVIAISLPLLQ